MNRRPQIQVGPVVLTLVALAASAAVLLGQWPKFPSGVPKGKDGQYDPSLTGLPQPEQSHDRDNWQPLPNSGFFEGNPPNSLWRVLELVSLSIKD